MEPIDRFTENLEEKADLESHTKPKELRMEGRNNELKEKSIDASKEFKMK